MYLTRLIVVLILLVATMLPLAFGAARDRRLGHRVVWRFVIVLMVVPLALYWATRPGLPGVLDYAGDTYFIGDAGAGTGIGDLGCPGIGWTLDRVGPARRVGYVSTISDHGDPEAHVVQGGLFHGGPVLQPLSQVQDQRNHDMNILLVERGDCIYQAQNNP